jgi:hypothetical protein
MDNAHVSNPSLPDLLKIGEIACRRGARTLALGRQIVRKPNFMIPDNQRLAGGEQVSMPKSA